MTAKELVLERAQNWSEEDAEVALRAVEEKHQHEDESGEIIDEWGNLDAMLDDAAGDLMADLDKEEIETSGETLADAWTRKGLGPR